MANVLHRLEKLYIESVNTPDFPEEEWIINPDVSSVIGLPVKYWVVEGDTVRPMTAEEQTTYDESNKVININRLEDGTPSYKYKNHVISITDKTLVFSLKCSGGKKYKLPFANTGSAFKCDRNYLLTSISVDSKSSEEFTLILTINSVDHRYVIGSRAIKGLEIELNSTDVISVSVESDYNVIDPVIILTVAYRN